MHISREDQKSVYRSKPCRIVFRQFDNACLRKRKPILALVQTHNLQVPQFSRKRLVEILQNLLKQQIFQSDQIARGTFPELFETSVTSVQQGGAVLQATGVMSVIVKEQEKLLKVIEGYAELKHLL